MERQPAFARPAVMQGPDDSLWDTGHTGMSTRTYAFIHVMAGFAANPNFANHSPEQIVERARHLITVGLEKLTESKGESS